MKTPGSKVYKGTDVALYLWSRFPKVFSLDMDELTDLQNLEKVKDMFFHWSYTVSSFAPI